MSAFAEYEVACRQLAPRTAIVLGSGLGELAAPFREVASIPFDRVPGLVPTTVHGHRGRLAIGNWGSTPVLVQHGRVHFYEGHSQDVVTATVRVVARLGVKRIVLTNAAGGIDPALMPGSLMAIRAHISFLDGRAWRAAVRNEATIEPYSLRMIHVMRDQEFAVGRGLPVGVYAALTGPCYETPAEIRALAACGADAVGMSTALEAEAAAKLGLEVAGISCITNQGAGLGAEKLHHAEVLANAKLAVERLHELLGVLVASS